MVSKSNFRISNSTADKINVGLFKYAVYPEERFVMVNQTLVNLLGYSSKKELANIKLERLFKGPKGRDRFFNALREKKEIISWEVSLKRKDNKSLRTTITAFLVTSPQGRDYIEGIVENSFFKDEGEFLEKNFLQNLLDNIPDAIYFKDKKNRLVKVNKFYSQGVGLTPEEIIGKTDFDFFPYEQAKKMYRDDTYVLKTGQPIIGKIEKTLLPDGSWNQVITTKIPIYDNRKKVIGTMGVTRDMTNYALLEKERLHMVINVLRILGKILQMRDPYTFNHACRVGYIAKCIAEELGWSDNKILGIKLAGELHDIGKIGIPADILSKPGKLTDLEYKVIQGHVEKCYELLKGIEFPFPLVEAIYQHHERLDGSGYPQGLKGDEIIIEARILAIGDILEAICSHRPYREALGLEKAKEELIKGAGVKYDKSLVDIALGLIRKNNHNVFWLNA